MFKRYIAWQPSDQKANRRASTTTQRLIALLSCFKSVGARRLAVQQPGGQKHAQLAQLVDRQCDVAVFAVEVFGQVEQQGADAGEGFVAIGNEGFVAGVGRDGEEHV